MPKDFLQLPRSALTDELWRNKEYGCLIWFLLSIADDQGIATFTAADIKLRFGISRQRLRTMLGKIQKSGLATNCQPTANQQATNIAFDFQCIAAIEQPTTNQLPTNKQPTKTRKATAKFTPPSDEEVADYVAEKGYHFNPAEFVPFYQTRGWKMKGGEPMKDWKAGCRYWETNWKQKHGERFYYEIQPIATTDNAATRAQSRDRLRSLAAGVLSQNTDKLLSLYNGGCADSDNRKD